MQPSDALLTRRGLSPERTDGSILLVACGALAREILELIRLNQWTHMDLQCLPAILHNSPEKITPAVRDIVNAKRAHYDTIFIVYADCGTGA